MLNYDIYNGLVLTPYVEKKSLEALQTLAISILANKVEKEQPQP